MLETSFVSYFLALTGFFMAYAIIIGNYKSVLLVIVATLTSIVSIALARMYGISMDAYIQSAFQAVPIGGAIGAILAIINAVKTKTPKSGMGGTDSYQNIMGDGLPKNISHDDERLLPRSLEEDQARQYRRNVFERLEERTPTTLFRSGDGRRAEVIYQELKYGSITESQAREQVESLVGRRDADAVYNEIINDGGNYSNL